MANSHVDFDSLGVAGVKQFSRSEVSAVNQFEKSEALYDESMFEAFKGKPR